MRAANQSLFFILFIDFVENIELPAGNAGIRKRSVFENFFSPDIGRTTLIFLWSRVR